MERPLPARGLAPPVGQLRPSDRPNVVLHVVPREVRSWLSGPVAPRPAMALDLADDRDPRSQEVARAFLANA